MQGKEWTPGSAPALHAARPKTENKRGPGPKKKYTRITRVFERSLGPLRAYTRPPPSNAFLCGPEGALFYTHNAKEKK